MRMIRWVWMLMAGGLLPAIAMGAPPDGIDIVQVQALFAIYRAGARTMRSGETYALPHLRGPIRADGVLEPAWQNALVVRLPYEISRGKNRPAPVETLALLGVTDTALVVAFICHDPRPEQMRVTLTDRDRLFNDDMVSVIVDTLGDQRYAYEVFVNPINVQGDALRSEVTRFSEDMRFDFLWYSGTRRLEDGYVVEIVLPFQYLRYRRQPDGTVTWRLLPFRIYPRDIRYQISPIEFDFDRNCILCQLPIVTFPLAATPREVVQVIPYGTVVGEGTSDAFTRSAATGVDVKLQPSPEWTLDATIHPDFSQVETDAFQITTNIRFVPFYPERRPFFMERSDLFRTMFRIFYSRTLIEPLYGIRMTGTHARHTVAFLHLRDARLMLWFPGVQSASQAVLDRPSTNTILHYRYNVGQQSSMGFFMTDREYAGGFNRLWSLDGRWYLSRRWTLSAQVVATWTDYPRDIARMYGQRSDPFWGWAAQVRFARSGNIWAFGGGVRTLSDTFRADMGFIQQVGIQEIFGFHTLNAYPDSRWINQIEWFASGGLTRSHDGRQQSHELTSGIRMSGIGQSAIYAGWSNASERVGDMLFHLNRGFAGMFTSPWTWLSMWMDYSLGDGIDYFLNARVRQVRASMEIVLKPIENLSITYNTTFRRLAEPRTLQTAWIHFGRVEWQITPRLAVRQLVQWREYRFPDVRYQNGGYPAFSRALEVQTLVRYRWNYATALYVGFYGRWETEPGRPSRRNFSVFAKWTYLWNLSL